MYELYMIISIMTYNLLKIFAGKLSKVFIDNKKRYI